MDEVIFLEVLEGDSVHARHRLERFPVTVGRGYANDVILDDPKVSTVHLRLERGEGGAVVLRDVGSRNGTFQVEPWAPLAELVLVDDTRVAVGDTVLRFRSRAHAVEVTRITARPSAPRAQPFDRPFAFPAVLAVAVGASLLDAHLTNYEKTDWGALALAVFAPVAATFVWALLWSIASKIARRQFHFGAHGSIGSLGLLGVLAFPAVLDLLTFSLSLGTWVGWVLLLLFLGWAGCVLFWHLRYVTRWEPKRLAGVLAVVLGCFGALLRAEALLGEEEFTPYIEFERTLLPPAFRLVPAHSVDDFFRESQKKQEEVDALVQER
jgi:hypothetical protein